MEVERGEEGTRGEEQGREERLGELYYYSYYYILYDLYLHTFL